MKCVLCSRPPTTSHHHKSTTTKTTTVLLYNVTINNNNNNKHNVQTGPRDYCVNKKKMLNNKNIYICIFKSVFWSLR